MKRNHEDTQATVQHLIAIARKHFTERGYAATTLDELALEAELTRGAVYHHFKSKKGLFLSVLESVQEEVAERVEAEASRSEDMREQLLAGCRAFVAAAVEPDIRRIMLIDGPAVLGWEAWRSMDEQNSMRLLQEQLQAMQNEGMFRAVPIEALTHFLSGALNESALWVAQAQHAEQALEQTMQVISATLDSFNPRL